jgi:hypothetical protein
MAQARGDYAPNSFASGDFRTMLDRLALAWGCAVADLQFTAYYSYDGASERKDITLGEVEAISGILPPLGSVLVHYQIGKPDGRTAQFGRTMDGMRIAVEADDVIRAQNVLNMVVQALKLSPYEPEFMDEWLAGRVEDLELRLVALERRASEAPLRCFLSFRFSESSAATAREVEQYLTLMGVEVVSGIEYEPRRVEDKVRDRLLSGVDFVVYLVTSEGESSWLRDELATATAQGAIPVPLVEAGSHVDPGLLGNIEYIPFAAGHPGDCWIRLAQAVRYVAAARLSTGERAEAPSEGPGA